MATSGDFSTSNQYIKYRIVVTETSTDIASNTSWVNVKVQAWRTNTGYETYGSGTCYANIDGANFTANITSSQKITYNSYTTLLNIDHQITHNADGSKTIYVSAYISHSRFTSNSQGFNVTLSTIPRQANLTAAPNFYDVDNPTITYSNPAGNAVSSLQACISLTGSTDNIRYRDISKTGTTYTFNLTQAERNVLLAACPNSNTLSVRFYVKTVLAGQTYYSILTRTMTVKNANPTISGAAYSDTNSTTTAITNNNKQIIQGQSTVSFSFTSLAAQKYATLTKVEITANAVTVSSSLSGSSVSNKTVAFGTINASSNISASIKLTDSRGNTTTQSLNITMLAWSLPTAIISLRRKSNYYEETYLNVNAEYSSLDNKNSITIQYQYKDVTGSSWSALTSIQDDVTATLSLDNEKAFDFRVIVSDRIGSTTYNKRLQVGIPIMYIDKALRAVGVGTIPTESNMLEADRRISLKNVNHERVADLWSYADGDFKSASLYFYNSAGNYLVNLGGRVNGGSLSLNNTSGNARAYLFAGSNGGVLNLYNTSGNNTASLISGSAGDGTLNLYNSSGTYTINLSGQNGVGNFYNSSGTRNIILDGSNGKITCVSLTQTSSRKVKDNIQELDSEEALKILELVAVTFDYKDKALGTDKRGFIAEDVAEVIPELVTPETEETNAALDYIGMIPYLQAVIKQQEERIKALEDKVEELISKVDSQS